MAFKRHISSITGIYNFLTLLVHEVTIRLKGFKLQITLFHGKDFMTKTPKALATKAK